MLIRIAWACLIDVPSFIYLDGLYDQKALQEYILYAGQHPVGGLRDKPPKYVFCSPITLASKIP